ncbi:hypothetical protein EDB84DRAFT_1267450 [Lactarius hengduanensis]|nr:hypothetical protein EDB84DRAFT_1267450 [Lactarius hengduanensis]
MRPTQVIRFPEKLLSNVHRGTAFEKRALSLLTEHMSMSLTRVGGSNDGGVDLIGWWWVPGEKRGEWGLANRRRLRVLAQCKAEKRKMGPGYLRELEGVVYRHATTASDLASGDLPHHDDAPALAEPPPVALLVSESAFTRGCLLAANASPLPSLLVHLPPSGGPGSGGGAVGAIFGNPALVSATGVLRGELEIRWEHGVPFVANGRPRLWWQGRPLPSWTPDNANADATLLT